MKSSVTSRTWMPLAVLALLCVVVPSALAQPKHSYLFVWAGDADHTASDFLGVIDADPSSKTYGHIVASVPTGSVGTHPHHTEDVMRTEQSPARRWISFRPELVVRSQQAIAPANFDFIQRRGRIQSSALILATQ